MRGTPTGPKICAFCRAARSTCRSTTPRSTRSSRSRPWSMCASTRASRRRFGACCAPADLFIVSTPDRRVYSARGEHFNEFHMLELTEPEFESFLHANFAHAMILSQRAILGSVIAAPEGGGPWRSYERRAPQSIEASSGLARAPYLIGVASDAELPDVASSVYIDRRGAGEAVQGAQRAEAAEARAAEFEHVVARVERQDYELRIKDHELRIKDHELREKDDGLTRKDRVIADHQARSRGTQSGPGQSPGRACADRRPQEPARRRAQPARKGLPGPAEASGLELPFQQIAPVFSEIGRALRQERPKARPEAIARKSPRADRARGYASDQAHAGRGPGPAEEDDPGRQSRGLQDRRPHLGAEYRSTAVPAVQCRQPDPRRRRTHGSLPPGERFAIPCGPVPDDGWRTRQRDQGHHRPAPVDVRDRQQHRVREGC